MLPKDLRRYQVFPISFALKESNSTVVSYLPLGGVNVAKTVKYGHCNNLTRLGAKAFRARVETSHIGHERCPPAERDSEIL